MKSVYKIVVNDEEKERINNAVATLMELERAYDGVNTNYMNKISDVIDILLAIINNEQQEVMIVDTNLLNELVEEFGDDLGNEIYMYVELGYTVDAAIQEVICKGE